VINLDEDAEDGRVVALQSLSNTQLIRSSSITMATTTWRKWSKTS
jgi:hypothetical protein